MVKLKLWEGWRPWPRAHPVLRLTHQDGYFQVAVERAASPKEVRPAEDTVRAMPRCVKNR